MILALTMPCSFPSARCDVITVQRMGSGLTRILAVEVVAPDRSPTLRKET